MNDSEWQLLLHYNHEQLKFKTNTELFSLLLINLNAYKMCVRVSIVQMSNVICSVELRVYLVKILSYLDIKSHQNQ